MSTRILNLVDRHERWRGEDCINLIPSENVMSARVRALLTSDMAHRYTSLDGFYSGTKYLDEVERIGEEIAKDLFGAESADLRPISGHTADMIFLSAFAQAGDKLLTVAPADGGYPGISGLGFPKVLGLTTLHFPFEREQMTIASDDAAELIAREKPRIVVFGASFIPFPHPVEELSSVCKDNGAVVAYDGSHVLGLISGGMFQQPLKEGADVLLGSTHKSLFGPQGGIILSDSEHGQEMRKIVHPALVDNAHWNRVAALALALSEMKRFGKRYAQQIIRNSQALARALDDMGVEVRGRPTGYTRSHQVILEGQDIKKGKQAALQLEQANLIVDSGVRLGTAEVTRRGMREPEMDRIAEFIARVLVKREDPRRVRREVTRLRRQFPRILFA